MSKATEKAIQTSEAEVVARCATCRFYFADDNMLGRQGICDANPPTAIFVPVSDPVQGQGLALQPVRPPVGADHWCGKYQAGENPAYARDRARKSQGNKAN